MEGATNYKPNVVSFKITVGWKRWFVVNAYVTSNEQPVVHRVEQVLVPCPAGTEMLLFSDLNYHLVQPCDQREEDL